MTAYYNEHDPRAAAWLRELIKVGVIADGFVDERDIRDVRPRDLRGFTQCHFFAGIGVWSYALRLAGWSDDRQVWTGSCPCQPFSQGGRGKGFADERHLWPHWFHLITFGDPVVIFGEQVANGDGLEWFDLVQSDLEATQRRIGIVDLCAAGFGAPHIRQRLYFVADTDSHGREARSEGRAAMGHGQATESDRGSSLMGHASGARLEGHTGNENRKTGRQITPRPVAQAGVVGGFWSGAELIYCRDEKWRPVEPGSFPLADEPAARVGRLCGYGNAIVADQAAEFIRAYDMTSGR